VHIENDFVRIELDDDTGGFRSIYDKRLGREYIGAPYRALLFRLITPDGDRACEHLNATKVKISISDNVAEIRCTRAGIEAHATLTLDGPAITAQLRLVNNGTRVVEEVMFPWIRGIAPIAGASVVWPRFTQRRIEDLFGKGLGGDHRTWNEWTQKVVARYPEHLASAWCDFGTAEGGLGIEGRQQDFAILDFALHKVIEKTYDPVRRSLDIVTVAPHRVRPSETYTSPPVRIAIHPGDWHATADAHRTWLDGWIAKPDRPARFAEAIGWHFFFMKHQDGLELHTYADLPNMAASALEAGCPYLLVFGWQTGGHDNHYFYRYVPNEDWGGVEALREAIETCRAMGVEVIPFFNGTLANMMMPEHKAFGQAWEARTRAGHPYYAGDWARHNFDAPTRNRAMLHHEVCFCADQRTYFLESIDRIVRQYGFGNTQLDQISEKMLCCYDEAHGHGRPDRAPVEGLSELLPATRRIVREANPEGVMVSEAVNEFTGQWCDSSWDWNALLPFPEPILYTLPWLMTSHEIDALEFGEVNKAFAYKMHLDMKIDGGDAAITKYPAFAAHVRRNALLRQRLGAFYSSAAFRDQEGVRVVADADALVKVYTNGIARTAAIIVAETGGHEAAVRIAKDWRAAKGALTVDSNRETPTDIEDRDALDVALKPYEVRAFCIPEALRNA